MCLQTIQVAVNLMTVCKWFRIVIRIFSIVACIGVFKLVSLGVPESEGSMETGFRFLRSGLQAHRKN